VAVPRKSHYPLVNITKSYGKPIETDSLPMKNGWIFQFANCLEFYQEPGAADLVLPGTRGCASPHRGSEGSDLSIASYIYRYIGNMWLLYYIWRLLYYQFCGDIPLHRPYIGLIYGRCLQFRILEWPLILYMEVTILYMEVTN